MDSRGICNYARRGSPKPRAVAELQAQANHSGEGPRLAKLKPGPYEVSPKVRGYRDYDIGRRCWGNEGEDLCFEATLARIPVWGLCYAVLSMARFRQ